MSKLDSIIKVFSFIVVGIVTIIVGAFMLRGTMHLWDKKKLDEDKSDT
ncbi:MAG: hypothetical protein ACK4TO_07325 [Candidatus Nitrosotenuis sp.]